MKGNLPYFTRNQRIAITVLFFLIVVAITLNLTLRYWAPAPQSFIDSTFVAQVETFEKEMTLAQSEYSKREYTPQHYNYYTKQGQEYQKITVETELFDFDPNTLDSAGFVRLGLKPWMAKNICKYRQHGGVFHIKNDFQKIYGIDTITYNILEPYIQLPETIEKEARIIPDILIELNVADTTALQQITTARLAKGIVGYRKMLGGYANIEQLHEVYGMTDEKFDIIASHVQIDTAHIQKIKVNRSSVEYLKRHPYINFYQAKAINELRMAIRHIDNMEQLENLDEFTEGDIKRLIPYLSFE